MSSASFVLGFAELAEELRAQGKDPGVPVHEEGIIASSPPLTFQVTSTGVMLYTEGGQPLFLADVRHE